MNDFSLPSENITDDAAQQLLGSDYRANCKYTLSFTDEGVFVNRTDPSFCVDEVVEKDGRVVDGYLMSFKLENSQEVERDIMNFDEMVKNVREDVIAPKPKKHERDIYSLYEKQTLPVGTKIMLGLIIGLFLLGVYLLLRLTL